MHSTAPDLTSIQTVALPSAGASIGFTANADEANSLPLSQSCSRMHDETSNFVVRVMEKSAQALVQATFLVNRINTTACAPVAQLKIQCVVVERRHYNYRTPTCIHSN